MNYLLDQLFSWIIFLFGIGFPLFLILRVIGIDGFKEITGYEHYDSLLYRLNPIVKIVLSLAVMIVSAITIWWIGALLTAGMVSLYVTLKNGKRKAVVGGLFVLSTVIGTSWGYAPFATGTILNIAFPGYHPYVLWTWTSYFAVMGYQHVLTLQAMLYGFQISFRTSSILASALLLVMTNTPSQILRTLHKVSVPDAIIFSLMVGMKTIPAIFSYLDQSMKIQMLRGLGQGKPKALMPIYMLIAGLSAIVPTIVHLMRGAKDTAISADTRGFRATRKRSYVDDIAFQKRDYYALSIIAMMVVVAAASILLGFGRTIPYVS